MFEQTPGLQNMAVTQEQIDAFAARFGKRLPAGLADQLVNWYVDVGRKSGRRQ